MNTIEKFPLNRIRYLDGTRLRYAILAGISHLEQYQDYLDRINVFPVPDGDTGTKCIVSGESADHLQIKTRLLDLGDSLIVAGGAKRIRGVHADPGTIGFIFIGYK